MCIPRASGAEFDPDRFLEDSSFDLCKVYRRGEPRHPKTKPSGARYQTSGMNITVSDASWSELSAQIVDAERFFKTHNREIERLASSPGVSDLTLDFPVELRIGGDNIVAQFESFPASLVRLAGALGVGLELSIYPGSDR